MVLEFVSSGCVCLTAGFDTNPNSVDVKLQLSLKLEEGKINPFPVRWKAPSRTSR